MVPLPPPAQTTLNPRDRQIALTFRTQLEKLVPVLEFRVFGSRARGEATAESDLDLFIKVAKLDRSLREQIYELAWEIGFEHDRLISPFMVTEQQIQTGPIGASPLLAQVRAEGIEV